MKRATDKIAFFVSALSSPFLIIPLFSLITINHYSQNTRDFMILGSIFVCLSILIPFLYILFSVKQGEITDVHVMIREQRAKPFIVAIAGSLTALVAYYVVGVPHAILAMSWALLVNGIFFALITMYWKISIHSATFASSLVLVAMLVDARWLFLSPIIILIFWTRLFRKKHNIWQLLVATIISPVITAAVLFVFGK